MKSAIVACTKQSPGYRARAFGVMVMFSVLSVTAAYADTGSSAEAMPHVDHKAKADFPQYMAAGKHRAFAIAPGGAWSWRSDAISEAEAEREALQSCRAYTQQKCVLYALNERIVFDKKQWPTLWGPYLDRASAASASAGTAVGERFPDIVWKDSKQLRQSLSGLQGKLVFLHFWGSWCPPCLREFPSLRKMHEEITNRFPSDVEMVMLQLREPFEESLNWVKQYEFSDLPLYDSGADSDKSTLTLSNGSLVQDRNIARVFPSTYVLDRNGLVIFSHHGPVDDWLEYVSFLQHAVTETSENGSVKSRAASSR